VRLASLGLPATDRALVARAYGTVLGIAFSEAWRATIGRQQVVLHDGDGTPVVDLVAEDGAPLDVVRLGIRWRRRAAPAT
jgi:hypothetical protein